MEFFTKYKKILIGILVVVALFIAYAALKPKKDGATAPITVEQAGGVPKEASDIVVLLSDLKTIKIDTSFFESPALRPLRDFALPLAEEPKGRVNPFAPFSDAAVGETGAGGKSKQSGPAF